MIALPFLVIFHTSYAKASVCHAGVVCHQLEDDESLLQTASSANKFDVGDKPSGRHGHAPMTALAGVSRRSDTCTVSKAVELVLVLDDSWSMTNHTSEGKTIIDKMLETLELGDDKISIGVVFFSNSSHIQLQFSTDVNAIEGAVGTWLGRGYTYMEKGLDTATEMLTQSNRDTKKFIVFFTDGENARGKAEAKAAADRARRQGIEIYALGIGNGVDRDTVNAIASEPQATYSFIGSTFAGFDQNTFQTSVCSAIQAFVIATGDPHMVNLLGQKFDLVERGHQVLINIPQGASPSKALLRVDALVSGGANCNLTFIRGVNMSGAWVNDRKGDANGYQYYAAPWGSPHKKWRVHQHEFGPVRIKVTFGKTFVGMTYFNLHFFGLQNVEMPVGGLLGIDDHANAASMARCAETLRDMRYTNMSYTEAVHDGDTGEAIATR